MKLLITIALVVSMMLTVNVSASITLSELTTELNITGGDSVTRNIAIENTDGSPVTVSFETIVIPDGEGINITYSESSPLTLKGNEQLTVTMFINTSLLLMPGTYQITTKFYTEEPSPTPKTVHYSWYTSTPVLPTNETNETIPPIIPPEENNTNETIPVSPPAIESGFNWYLIGIPLAIISIFMLLFLLYKRRKKNK